MILAGECFFFCCCSCQWLHKFQRFFISTLPAHRQRRHDTEPRRRRFLIDFPSPGENYSLNGVYLMMELRRKRESRVYKVISRRIIKHHGMILECFLWWCLASSSSLFLLLFFLVFLCEPRLRVLRFYSWNQSLESVLMPASWRLSIWSPSRE